MKVCDLIEELQKYDQNCDIQIARHGDEGSHEIVGVWAVYVEHPEENDVAYVVYED